MIHFAKSAITYVPMAVLTKGVHSVLCEERVDGKPVKKEFDLITSGSNWAMSGVFAGWTQASLTKVYEVCRMGSKAKLPNETTAEAIKKLLKNRGPAIWAQALEAQGKMIIRGGLLGSTWVAANGLHHVYKKYF